MRRVILICLFFAACGGTERNPFRTEDGRRYEMVIERSAGCDCSGEQLPLDVDERSSIERTDGEDSAPVTLLSLPDGLAVCPAGTTAEWNAELGRTVVSAPCSPIVCEDSSDCPRSYIHCTAEHRCR